MRTAAETLKVVQNVGETVRLFVEGYSESRANRAERIVKGIITPQDRENFRSNSLLLQYHGVELQQLRSGITTEIALVRQLDAASPKDIMEQIDLIPDAEIDQRLQEQETDKMVRWGFICRWPRK